MYDIYGATNTTEENRAQTFVNFFIHYCLRHFFKSKKEMSQELGIGYRSILLVTNSPGRYKGATLVFQELVVFCIRKGISMDEIAYMFHCENEVNLMNRKHLMQVFNLYIYCPLFVEYEHGVTQKQENALLAEAHLFMLHVRMIYCKSCVHFWTHSNLTECLIQQTMSFLMLRLCEE